MRNMKSSDMAPMAREASELLDAMANEKRLTILCMLLDGEITVNDLAGRVGMSQSALKLVDTRREAQQIYYRLSSTNVERVLETLYGIYCE